MKEIKVYLEHEVSAAVEDYTKELGMSVSSWIRKTVHAELNRRKRLRTDKCDTVWVKISKRL